jgi:hypothetical protein
MAGLLDILGSDTGLLGLQLMAAGSAKPVRTGFGEGLLSSLQAVQAQRAAEEDRKARQQMQAMQMQQMQEAVAARKQAQEQQQQRMSYLGAIDSEQGPAMPLSVPRALSAGLSLPEIGALSPQKIDPMAGFDKVSPKDYTPESLAAFMQTRNPAVLRAAPKDQTPDEFERALKLAGIDPASPQGRQMATARAQKMATHQPGVSVSYGAPMAGQDSAGNSVFFQPSKDGGQPSIVQGVKPAQSDKPMTEAQAKAAVFQSQMAAAEKELGAVKRDASKITSQADIALASSPLNAFASPAAQRARQSQEQWAEAFLRFKTGAASTEEEVKRNVKTFFPQQGDKPDVIEQKARMRQQAQHDVSIAAGSKSPLKAGGAKFLGFE